jgi:single-stranded-DNA-specific exonuclease
LVGGPALQPEFVRQLAKLGPFGTGNPEPRFVLPHMRVLRADVVGDAHLRLILADGAGAGRLKAIAFRAVDGPLAPALLQSGRAAFHVAGHLRADRWQGREDVQLLLDDAAPAL